MVNQAVGYHSTVTASVRWGPGSSGTLRSDCGTCLPWCRSSLLVTSSKRQALHWRATDGLSRNVDIQVPTSLKTQYSQDIIHVVAETRNLAAMLAVLTNCPCTITTGWPASLRKNLIGLSWQKMQFLRQIGPKAKMKRLLAARQTDRPIAPTLVK